MLNQNKIDIAQISFFKHNVCGILNDESTDGSDDTKKINIERVKFNDLQYSITYGVAMPSNELYEIYENKCQTLYSIITGGLK